MTTAGMYVIIFFLGIITGTVFVTGLTVAKILGVLRVCREELTEIKLDQLSQQWPPPRSSVPSSFRSDIERERRLREGRKP